MAFILAYFSFYRHTEGYFCYMYIVSLMVCAVFSGMLNPLVLQYNLLILLDQQICPNINMHCIKSKFYLFSIAIKSTHILVGMQYTYINLDTNNTIYIFYGSIEIWFTSNKIIQLNGTIEKNYKW